MYAVMYIFILKSSKLQKKSHKILLKFIKK